MKPSHAVAAGLLAGCVLAQPASEKRKQADLHTAIALTQASLYGTTGVTARANQQSPTADVLMLVAPARAAVVRSRLAKHGMPIQFDDPRSGYIRATVPFPEVHLLFEWSDVDAVRVDGLAAYDTRLQPQDLASLGFSVSGDEPSQSAPPEPAPPRRPPLTRTIARAAPVNSDDEMGVTEFRHANPMFDGRGVGIGVVESTWIPLDHPAYGSARALDGTRRRKVLRYLDCPSARRDGFSAPWSDWCDCKSTVCEVHGRLVRLPATGRYRLADVTLFGRDLGDGRRGSARYAAVLQETTRRIHLDANGDLDFSNERPLVDFNDERWNEQSIVSLPYPGAASLKAVVTMDSSERYVWLHPFTVSHATMTSSVAAGSDDDGNLAMGVAPNASLVFVDSGPRARLLSHAIEGMITLARDKDVDVLYLALVIQTPLGTLASFDATVFDRISEAYDKPVLVSAGNYMVPLSNSPSPSGRVAMAVGQYTSSRTVEALFGVTRPEVPEYASTVGPAIDGSSRPDFLAASKRVAAAPCEPPLSNTLQTQFAFPPCYLISGGTSAASPSAAGAVALLLSAAKQRGMKPGAREIHDALIASATLMPGVPPHMQGAGLINLPRAWAYLQRSESAPGIDIEGELRHRFAKVLDGVPPRGLILIARSDTPQEMAVALRSKSHRTERVSIRSEGSLVASLPSATSIDPNRATRVPVRITPPSLGHVASAWLTFSSPSTGTVMGRALATAAHPAPLSAPRYEYEWRDEVEFGTHRDTLIDVPAGTTGLLVEYDLQQGDGVPVVANGWSLPLLPRAYWSGGQYFSTPYRSSPGRRAGVLLDPAAGDWGVVNLDTSMIHASVWSRTKSVPDRVSIGVRMTAFRTACHLLERSTASNHIRVSVNDVYAQPVDGGVLAAPAVVTTSRLTLRDEFERTPVTIDVKPTTATFHIDARPRGGADIMLQLFDCTSGHCLAVTQSAPGEPSPALNVRAPQAGIWKVFAVPIRPLYQSMLVDVTVTSVITDDLTLLAPSNQSIFEGQMPHRDGASGLVLFRTDARAAANKEGWGAISLCLPAAQATELGSNRARPPRDFFFQEKR